MTGEQLMVRGGAGGQRTAQATASTDAAINGGGPRARERSPLSQREREIAELVAQGYKNKEIAEKIFISEQTVKNHVHNIFDKLGMSDRLQLALYAILKLGGRETVLICDVPASQDMTGEQLLVRGSRDRQPVAQGTVSTDAAINGGASRARERSPLSPREREIVQLVTQGYKNKEMAEKMLISEQTVKNHLHNVFDKLGVSDRLELALYAIDKGLHLAGDRIPNARI